MTAPDNAALDADTVLADNVANIKLTDDAEENTRPREIAADNIIPAENVANVQLTDVEEDMLLQDTMDCVNDGLATVEESQLADRGRDECGRSSTPPTWEHGLMLMDMQLIYYRGVGNLVKEMACKMWNSNVCGSLNMKHSAENVPSHLVVPSEDGKLHYDVYTGLALEEGEVHYDDKHVADILSEASSYGNVVVVKGINKKKALEDLCDRTQALNRSFVKPVIVNVDGHTADEQDREFCRNRGIRLATFSFSFVYTNMQAFERLLFDRQATSATTTSMIPVDFLYLNNVLSKDHRYNLTGRGRIVCVCYNDHSRGGTVHAFDKTQRCSLLNISILDHLWLRQQDAEFRTLIRSYSRKRTGGNAHRDSVYKRRRSGRRRRRTGRNPEQRRRADEGGDVAVYDDSGYAGYEARWPTPLERYEEDYRYWPDRRYGYYYNDTANVYPTNGAVNRYR